MRPAQHRHERHQENFFAFIVADVQGPVAPVLRTGGADEGVNDAGGAFAGFGQVLHRVAVPIEQQTRGARAVEIDVGHVRLLIACQESRQDQWCWRALLIEEKMLSRAAHVNTLSRQSSWRPAFQLADAKSPRCRRLTTSAVSLKRSTGLVNVRAPVAAALRTSQSARVPRYRLLF